MFGIVIYDRKGILQLAAYLMIIIYAPSKGLLSYNHRFIVQAIVMIVNYDRKTLIVQATVLHL
jgi:hypothetical protein